MKRRASVSCLDYMPIDKKLRSVLSRKRRLSYNLASFVKKVRFSDPEPESNDIYIVITELNEPEYHYEGQISSSDQLAYLFSSDPRDHAATDIQRVVRGWLKRKVFKKTDLSFCFNSMAIT